MDEWEKLMVTIFGGILTIAVVSVVVSRKSQTPEAISAFGGALSSVVSAAVNPQSVGSSGVSSQSNNGTNAFSSALNEANSAIMSGLTSGFGGLFS